MKKYLVLTLALLFALSLPISGIAGDCEGPNCEPTVNADVQPAVGIHGMITIVPGGSDLINGAHVQDPASNGSGNFGTADVTLKADASATGADTIKQVKVGYEYSGEGYYYKGKI